LNAKTFFGVILVIIGVLWTLSNFQLINSQWFLPAIGLVFVAPYFYKGSTKHKGTIGFLIAGCIIIMVGLFTLINDSFHLGLLEGSLFFFFVGMAFLPVYFIHTRHLTNQDSGHQRWPLYTSLVTIGFGIFVLLTETAHTPLMRRIYPLVWPSLLIILGLYIILFKRLKK
jgi:hypothetical protein